VSDVNSTLPDGDALAAFANSALGGGRRRRRPQTADTGSADAKPKETGETAAPAPAPQPTAAQEQQEPAQAAVPTPTRAPEAEQTPAPREEPAPPAATGGGEVAVRAVAVPMTRTSMPPGLQGGPVEVRVPALGPSGARATQCTIMISQSVRDRFAHYQLAKKMAGDKEPSNALVVRRAFLYCRRADVFGKLLADVYQQHNAVDEEDYDEDGLLGEVIDRRVVRGRIKDSGQQSFRPSEQELATYDAYSQAYGFPSRSDFLGAVLDEFLPQLPASGRRK